MASSPERTARMEARRDRVAALLAEGLSPNAIALRLGKSLSMICYDVAVIRGGLRKRRPAPSNPSTE